VAKSNVQRCAAPPSTRSMVSVPPSSPAISQIISKARSPTQCGRVPMAL